jgi:hypothetical protein
MSQARNQICRSASYFLHAVVLLVVFFDLEDEGDMFL